MSKTKPKRVALYIRVSTGHQATSTAMQKADLLQMCESRGLEVHRVYEDVAESGGKDSRPALDELMRDVRQGKVNMVVVWRFDRWGRSLKHLVDTLTEFERLGVDFVSYCESIDTSSAMGRVLFAIIAAIAEFERHLIRERVKAGVQRAKESGKRLGRPRKGFPYAEALEMRQEGASLRQIAKRMGVSHSTVLRAIGTAG